MRYVKSKIKQFDREEAYRVYVTKGIEILARMKPAYLDLFKPVETRSGDEIKKDIQTRLNALGGKHGSTDADSEAET